MQTTTETTRDEPDSPLSAVLRAADSMVSSPEPAVVFASLVQLCAPFVCEAASATVSGPDATLLATRWPRIAVDDPHLEAVITRFSVPASGDHAGYHGIVSLRFSSPDNAQPFIAQLLVERAKANVERERLAESVNKHCEVAENLELALSSNREIGVAVGILMANHKLTDEQAFDVLRRVSQRTNRKLRTIALEVARAGLIELPAGVNVVGPFVGGLGRLVSVPAPPG